MKVAKFGGSSLATAQQIKKVCNIITADPERRLIIVSAPGKSCDEDIKVTDLLIACAEQYLASGSAERELEAVINRYRDIAEDLGLSQDIIEEISADLQQRLAIETNNREKFMDALKAAGEDNCAKLVAKYLCSINIEAHYINPKEAGLLLSEEYGNARLLPESYQNLRKLRERSGILIFPGFFGYTPEGVVVTFSRGGSDLTGSILATAVEADLYENFTDVDSVFVANPKIISNPKAISQLTYREMRELAYAGFTVLHEETLVPIYKAGIPICIKNTNNPSAPGTLITREYKGTNGPVTGIAADKGFCSIYVRKFLMNREIGFGRKLLQILEDEGISYEHIPSGIDDMSVILKEHQLKDGIEKRILERIKNELEVDDVSIEHGLALIIIVGEGMTNTVGVATKATNAFAKTGISLEMINQGSSEISMMFAVKAEESAKAVISLYHEFFQKF
ncbi:MAG: aspartate kinase [Firmicutes bacterium]|nr:aspartate kinase [Bacillota bacterium]